MLRDLRELFPPTPRKLGDTVEGGSYTGCGNFLSNPQVSAHTELGKLWCPEHGCSDITLFHLTRMLWGAFMGPRNTMFRILLLWLGIHIVHHTDVVAEREGFEPPMSLHP